jgi:hypothetical protein
MRGVDVTDHLRGNYSCQLKCHKWWMKIFHLVVDQTTVNSYVKEWPLVSLAISKPPMGSAQCFFWLFGQDEMVVTHIFCQLNFWRY